MCWRHFKANDDQETCSHQLKQILSVLVEIECRIDYIHQRYLIIKTQLQPDFGHPEATGVVLNWYSRQHEIA